MKPSMLTSLSGTDKHSVTASLFFFSNFEAQPEYSVLSTRLNALDCCHVISREDIFIECTVEQV